MQQAWVARYNNGVANGTNHAVKMALDSTGNIYVTGFSQNSSSNLGYVTIKYAPNGSQLWAARYDSTNYPGATPSGLVLDNSNNVIVTGSALTIKCDSNGNQLWTAPYAGTALAVDTNGNCIVTGISTSFGTVKLDPNGSNLWIATYPSSYGPGVGQQVLTARDNSVYVAGYYTYDSVKVLSYQELLVIRYNTNGSQLWTGTWETGSSFVQINALAVDSSTDVYCLANAYLQPYSTCKFDADGHLLWAAYNPTANGGSVARGLALDAMGDAVVTGADGHYYPNTPYPIGTYKIGTNGAYVWTNLYYSIPIAGSVGTAVAVDQANSVYVTGYSPGTNSGNDIVTIKYANNGNQIWVQRYNGPGNGDDEGNAIAVDNNGNVYVTGYETTAAGGTEMVTIKYAPPTPLQRRADGTMLLQAQGSPGENFDIQASADLQLWLDLGIVTADTNGLMQYDDTNAPNYPARFYSTAPR